jgi:hypothetical protein
VLLETEVGVGLERVHVAKQPSRTRNSVSGNIVSSALKSSRNRVLAGWE